MAALLAPWGITACGAASEVLPDALDRSTVLVADLRSAAGTSSTAGTATLSVERTGGRLCSEVVLEEGLEVIAMHLERGRPGSARQIVTMLPEAARGSTPSCQDLPSSVLDDIVSDAAEFVVNVRTATAPSGAAEGRLEAMGD